MLFLVSPLMKLKSNWIRSHQMQFKLHFYEQHWAMNRISLKHKFLSGMHFVKCFQPSYPRNIFGDYEPSSLPPYSWFNFITKSDLSLIDHMFEDGTNFYKGMSAYYCEYGGSLNLTYSIQTKKWILSIYAYWPSCREVKIYSYVSGEKLYFRLYCTKIHVDL